MITTDRKYYLFLIAFVLFGLLVRLWSLTFFEQEQLQLKGSDAQTYLQFERAIAENPNWLSEDISSRPPVYPVFLFSVFKVFGRDLTKVRIFQCFLSTLTIVLIYFLGRNIFNKKVALVTAAWFTISPEIIYFCGVLLRETFELFLLSLCLLTFLTDRLSRTAKSILSAFLLTVLIHADPRFLCFIPFWILWIFQMKWGYRQAALFVISLVVFFTPWTIRNYVVYDALVIVNSRTMMRKVPILSDYISSLPQGARTIDGFDDRFFLTKEDEEIRKHPLKFFALRSVYQMKYFWRVFKFTSRADRFYGSQYLSANNTAWSSSHNLVRILGFGVFLPFAVLGVIWGLRKYRNGSLLIFYTIVALNLVHVLQFGAARYRLPIEPLVILFASVALVRITTTMWNKRREKCVQSVSS
jgi:4-amino-4-deoxy-L-arabinose transferase-like glycosyltransferase